MKSLIWGKDPEGYQPKGEMVDLVFYTQHYSEPITPSFRIRNPQMFNIHARHVMDLAKVVRERRRRGIPTRTFWARWVMYSAYATARSVPPRRIPHETIGTFTVQSSAAAALSIWMTNLTLPKEWADA